MPAAITGGVEAQSLRLLDRLARSVDPRAAGMRRIVAAMEKAADKIQANAEALWPVDRNRRGDETKKKHGIRHSVELFDVRPVLHPTKIVVTVYNTAPYAYYIKSVMVGETSVQQRARHKWPRGMPADRYAAKRAVGKKRHAFTFLMRSPGRKAGRLLARELQADLVDLIQKEVS